jgi:Formate hydrogenlyase subunit 3/Multisubunit Na+/H+ antiporter, MnhD subunit
MSSWSDHLIIAPILIPLIAGAITVILGERQRLVEAGLSLLSAVLMLVVAVALLVKAGDANGPAVHVYRLGDWPTPIAIVLVLDRLAAVMLTLTGILGMAALTYAVTRWDRRGAHFHPLLQFQLMGLNGAFLTGDLFNLFVFFEVLLAASYGLALHGSGIGRVKAGLHYIVINLVASLVFLVGVSTIYGIAGTLNMAELAGRVATIPGADRGLLEAGAAILGIAFLIKAAMWPLGLWLPNTYAAASPPAATILSILSKVGVYVILRLWLMLFGDDAGESAGFGSYCLVIGGILTIVFGSIAVLATQSMTRLAGASVLVSSGTLLAAVGTGHVEVVGGALFYLVSSVLGIAAFFLLIELVNRDRELGADVLAVTREAYGGEAEEEEGQDEVGVAIPAGIAILGSSFLACGLLLAGLPPLSGFLGKFAILAPLFEAEEAGMSAASWTLLVAILISSLVTLIAVGRAGINVFWTAPAETVPSVRLNEIIPIAVLLGLSVALTVQADSAMEYMQAAAHALHDPQGYIRDVLGEIPEAVDWGAGQ